MDVSQFFFLYWFFTSLGKPTFDIISFILGHFTLGRCPFCSQCLLSRSAPKNLGQISLCSKFNLYPKFPMRHANQIKSNAIQILPYVISQTLGFDPTRTTIETYLAKYLWERYWLWILFSLKVHLQARRKRGGRGGTLSPPSIMCPPPPDFQTLRRPWLIIRFFGKMPNFVNTYVIIFVEFCWILWPSLIQKSSSRKQEM